MNSYNTLYLKAEQDGKSEMCNVKVLKVTIQKLFFYFFYVIIRLYKIF